MPGDGVRTSEGRPLRFAAVGAGFWARFQLAAWKELPDAECVAICDRARPKAEALARDLGVSAVHDDAGAMLRSERLDFVDVITTPDTHGEVVRLAASRGVPVICQKPMAPTLEEARGMVEACERAGVPFFVHENWRWQRPIREVRRVLDSGRIGRPFRARIDMISGFPVFENQPGLREVEELVVADLGVHLLDAARFLFGEAESVYCETGRVHADIRGEDVATVVLSVGGGRTTVVCEMAYAGNRIERECFPQTLIFVEATRGSLELAPDYEVRVTDAGGTDVHHCPPPLYPWVDPDYAVVHSSMVETNADLLAALREGRPAETHARDNLRTLELVFDAYRSAREGQVVRRRGAENEHEGAG